MKGIVFAELTGFLDKTGGELFTENVLDKAGLEHGGAYSRVGNYPFAEAERIVGIASEMTGNPASELCRAFGIYLFERFTVLYQDILSAYTDAESLLRHVNDHIHREVRMMYIDARPPQIETHVEGDELIVTYASHRPFAHIAHGLIEGAMKHFGDDRQLVWRNCAEDGRAASFALETTSSG
ncbi:guanylate cyclase [Erythrobacter litoralis]|nr:guanylate cyclase [Erythrobacter litoralis]